MNIRATDIRWDASAKRNPAPWHKHFYRTEDGKEFRLNFSATGINPKTNTITFSMEMDEDCPEELKRRIQEEGLFLGVLGGIPSSIGKDLGERIGALNRKERRRLIHTGRTWRQGDPD
jgi:hypothetical protein